mgnify:CR=1 FL=1
MLLQIFIISVFVAGISVAWRNLLWDIKPLDNFVGRFPYFFSKALRCGFCFTFWTALVVVLVANPLQGFSTNYISNGLVWIVGLVDIFVGWVVVAMIAVIIRFFYVVLQETVHYQVHFLRKDEHKH